MSENQSKTSRNQPPVIGGDQANAAATLRATEAAHLIGVDAKTLANWRWKGCGPAYFKLPGRLNKGAVRYDRDTVLAWLAQRICTSTSSSMGGDNA